MPLLLCGSLSCAAFTVHDVTPRRVATHLFLDGEGMANGIFNKHLLGDAIRSLQPRNLNQAFDAVKGNMKGATSIQINDMEMLTENVKSWEELSQFLSKKQQTNEERNFRELLKEGKVSSPLASKRLFGSDKEPKVTLYRDSAAWCPYCQKVWITLEEKQISYEIVRVDMNCYAGSSKPTDFLKVQPSGNLPCAVVHNDGSDDVVVGESDLILDMLDSMNPNVKPKLRPTGKEDIIKQLCDDGKYNSLERKLYSEWMWYLTGKRRPVEYRERFETQLDAVEEALASSVGGPYFLGKDISLADIKFIPFLERQTASLAYYKGFQVRDSTRWPNLVKWFEAMESRPSYQITKSDYYTHSRSLPPQLSAGCTFAPDEEDYQAMKEAIDACSMPILDGSDTTATASEKALEWIEPGWDFIVKKRGGIDAARREAAERLIANSENIVKFACRAAGTPGFPAAAAPLADPRSISNEDAEVVVDVLMRHVVERLLSSTTGGNDTIAIEKIAKSMGDEETLEAIVACLDYLRGRIGVPRDMSYPAARELKKELLIMGQHMLSTSRSEVPML